jgi:integrase
VKSVNLNQPLRVVLTDARVRALKKAKLGSRYDVLDALVPGLAVRVTDTGNKTFMFRTRYPGAEHSSRRALGKVGAMNVEQARAKARDWHQLLDKQIDPLWQAEQERLAKLRAESHTFLAVAEAYFAHIKSEGLVKAKIIERVVRKEFVSRWAARAIHDINQHDVAEVINQAKLRGAPAQAHSLFEYAKSLWSWAIQTGAYGLTSSPTDRLRAKALIGSKKPRQRVLSDDELRALWAATGEDSYPWQPLYRLLILTGQRLHDVADASWGEFDLKQRLWTIPPERFKSSVPQIVPLTNEMLAILATLPRFKSGEFLFSATWGKTPVQNFSKPKLRLDARMSPTTKPWVVHDIRRTVRSHLSALPVEQHVRELVIGHALKGLHKVYDRYEYLDEKRRALELWQQRLRGILNPTPDNVTRLPTRLPTRKRK